MDVFGPMTALGGVAANYPLNLFILADTLDPVSTSMPNPPIVSKTNSNFSQSIVPTHTFANPPDVQLDVLFIPGGFGTRAVAPKLDSAIDFIRTTYPSLQYLVTVCTGSALAARAGILDGRNATSNKAAFAWVETQGPNVNWITHARWVVDGNIYTTSGIAAGIDGTVQFIADVYNATLAQSISDQMEYVRWMNASYDPFADLYGL